MRVVVALGGNALLKRGEPMTIASQRKNIEEACRALAPAAVQNQLVITHGNGPRSASSHCKPPPTRIATPPIRSTSSAPKPKG